MPHSKKLLAGASGYSFKAWKGTFYPADMKPDAMLAFYSERLPTVEINNTFYQMPKVPVLESWARTVPASFKFAIKASRRITHLSRLKADSGVGIGEKVLVSCRIRAMTKRIRLLPGKWV